MKTLLLPVAILFALISGCKREMPTASPAQERVPAASTSPESKSADDEVGTAAKLHDKCAAKASFASLIMVGRQNGVPIADLMKNHPDDDAASRDQRKVILDAYARPRMNLDENQEKVVEDFESEVYLACYKEGQ